MKSSFQATAFLLGLSSFCCATLVVPDTSDSTSYDIVSVAGSTGADHVSITFTTPCDGCSLPSAVGLVFTLDVYSTDSLCARESVQLNGVPLPNPSESSLGIAPQSFRARRTDQSHETDDVEALVQFICMNDQTAFLGVTLTSVAGHDVTVPRPGFSASFTQASHPEILRLHSVPRSYHREVSSQADEWLAPKPEHKLVIDVRPSNFPPGIPQGLEAEPAKLEILELHRAELEKDIRNQKKIVMGIWKAEFSKCSTVTCYLQTALAKAPLFASLISDHIRHHTHIDVDFFRNATHKDCTDHIDQLLTQPQTTDAAHDELDELEPIAIAEVSGEDSDTSTTTSPTTPTESESSKPSDAPSSPFEHHGGPPPWVHGGRPPWVKPGGRPPWAKPGWTGGPPPWARPGGKADWSLRGRPGHHHTSGTHHLLPKLTRQQMFIGAVLWYCVAMVVVASLYLCIKHKARIFGDPRLRVDMIACREEWKTRRAYRKAACKHRVRTFFKRLRGIKTSDEDEKQAMLAPQDDWVANREIRNLRAAHQLVGDMMRAEEGQAPYIVRHARSGSGSESLPSYRSAPPGYASGLDGDISVVDGFTGYTPSASDDTPDSDSSIVDCSSRLSFETQRTS